jgi:hypothetical protein
VSITCLAGGDDRARTQPPRPGQQRAASDKAGDVIFLVARASA